MLIAVRHGKTASNTEGDEKLRGWLPIPLTLEGMEESRATAELIASNLDDADVSTIYCSDLVRAVQSANEIGEVLEMPISPSEDLRDFNTGELAGSTINPELIAKIHSYYDDPDKVMPGGESYNSFLDRLVPCIKECVESKDYQIMVVHGRIMTLINSLAKAKGKEPKLEDLKQKPPVDPSGVIIVGSDWKIYYSSPQKPESKRMS